jgi:hypothetical protein
MNDNFNSSELGNPFRALAWSFCIRGDDVEDVAIDLLEALEWVIKQGLNDCDVQAEINRLRSVRP